MMDSTTSSDAASRETRPMEFMVIAGEVSGDMHAARLIRELRRKLPSASFFGTGGPQMSGEGVEILQDIGRMAVMGFSEVAKQYFFFRILFNRLIAEAVARKPVAVILVDYPGFNLRLAERLHAMGIKTIYYICPQVWAWNRQRIPHMAKIIDRLLTIFPFEAQHFDGTGLKVDFVGHPLVEETQQALLSVKQDLPWTSDCRIALLPGSRKHEVDRLLSPLIESAGIISKTHPEASFIIAASSESMAEYIESKLAQRSGAINVSVVHGKTREILRQARAAIVASGTATVETALMGCPMVIVYKVALLTYLLGKMLVKIDHIGMVNIIAEKTICPELIQASASPSAIAQAALPLVNDTAERKTMLAELERVKKKLGSGSVEEKASDAILNEIASIIP